jgi:hypothetical protein
MRKLIFMTLFLTNIVFAANISEIVNKVQLSSYYQARDGKAQILMKVYPQGGGKPIKKLFYMLRLDITDGGEQMFFTYFVKPTDIKRTTFLVHKKINGDDYRRLYIPASDKILAIAGSRKQDPFMGSDFSYEDVSGRHSSKDTHKLLGEEKFNGKDVYITESTPKDKNDRNSKIKAWIDKSNYLPLKVQYFNKEGKVYRIYTSDKIKKIKDFDTIIKRTMTSPLTGTKTIMLVNPKKIEFNIGLEKKVFTERSLKNPPMNFLK